MRLIYKGKSSTVAHVSVGTSIGDPGDSGRGTAGGGAESYAAGSGVEGTVHRSLRDSVRALNASQKR